MVIQSPPQPINPVTGSPRNLQSTPNYEQQSLPRTLTSTSNMSVPRSQNRLPSRTRPYIPSQFYQQSEHSPHLQPNRESTPLSFHSSHHQPPHSRPPPSNQAIPIPSAIPPIVPQQDATPLPTLPIVVLCFAMISEFLSASVSGPFIFFMIEDFGVGGGEAAVGFWAGIVSSVFFLTQFLTSLLWSNVSNKHGRRVVLFSSLLGNAITLILFGSSTTLGMAICARLGQGIFNGAIGVARGAVRDLTDATNEGSAIAWIGLCWGMGGIAGPIIGGLLEHPAENYPALFGRFQLLKDYPYLLPCTVASSITFLGAILSLFLGWDGGYRTGKIQLTDSNKLDLADQLLDAEEQENEESLASNVPRSHQVGLLRPSNLQAISMSNASTHSLATANTSKDLSRSIVIKDPLAISRTTTRQSNAFVPGSAYGYDRNSTISRRPSNWRHSGHMGSIRSHLSTIHRRNSRAISLARSFGEGTNYAPDYEDLNGEENVPALNFAQRLLLANEDAVFGLHDVWLAAATTQDRDDEYSQMDVDEQEPWDGSIFADDDSRSNDPGTSFEDEASSSGPSSFDERGRSYLLQQQHPPSQRFQSQSSRRQSVGTGAARQPRPQSGLSPRHSFADGSNPLPPASAVPPWLDPKMRTTSMASSIRPAIFGNTGLATPRSMSQAPFAAPQSKVSNTAREGNATLTTGTEPATANLSVIPEGGISSGGQASEATTIDGNLASSMEELEKPTGLFKQLPLAIIAQYAILALHGTTCDQIFMSFLVTPIRSGGLGLSAGHYAELIAAMCIAQIVFQFRFYPTVGPPRGQLTHLSMFRLGLCLYIPVYMLLPELRGLLRENHNGLVMFGMILLCTFRWLGNVCAYTSVMVMINAQTPPHLIPLANGLAQSAVSASRFVGPVFGGMVWSFSITPSPDYRPYPFNNSFGFLVVSIICFIGLSLSFKLK
ncbi:hypothetical protein PGT21_010580 [Puccinia graminis f. sp. tritici]|uniref:Major facilitator superfamily (MFS) profile domain-containing protein n=1 Tax=Puccinia graminis f. sp. tritici TaxID=56615 RepID=A0A5B0LLT2_PUCGR|nr:hypothetical protein PGTUg99_023458 [Puccinia graminis f. sp. tritici]KAA1095029.1 hypothetical protein PGT21_034718 [Puccinia graminis f. sp. tritici]KAA1118931.1 hypothetical protein PGT21_010580 [Puccinia graminis f. sp. tritici]